MATPYVRVARDGDVGREDGFEVIVAIITHFLVIPQINLLYFQIKYNQKINNNSKKTDILAKTS